VPLAILLAALDAAGLGGALLDLALDKRGEDNADRDRNGIAVQDGDTVENVQDTSGLAGELLRRSSTFPTIVPLAVLLAALDAAGAGLNIGLWGRSGSDADNGGSKSNDSGELHLEGLGLGLID